jgi:hypothetical protein
MTSLASPALPSRITTAASGMWDGIKYAFKGAINWIIDKWNGLEFKIPGFSVFGVDVGGFTLGLPDIPRLHTGGEFRSPVPGGEGLALLRDREHVLTPEQMAQRWLWKNAGGRCRRELCRVFHMLESPRHSFCSGFGNHDPNSVPQSGGFPLVGGFKSDDERDAAMTDASTHDIAWVRPEKKKKNSGTAKNLQRRVEKLKAARAAEIASWPTAAVSVDVDGCDYRGGYVVHVEQAAEQDIVDEDKKLCRVPQPLIDRLSAAQARMDAAQREHSMCQRELMQLLVEQGLDVDVRHAQLVQNKE